MSVILLSLAGATGLWAYSRNQQFQKYRVEKKDSQWNEGVAQRFNSTGIYGDVAEVADLLPQPGYVVDQRFDTDLTGAPCRWLIMRNGGVYKTYDLQTNYISSPE